MAHEKAQTMAVNTIKYARTICMRLILRVYIQVALHLVDIQTSYTKRTITRQYRQHLNNL